jgi:hypothetical protein
VLGKNAPISIPLKYKHEEGKLSLLKSLHEHNLDTWNAGKQILI